jgi:hypothetical protein
VINGIQHLEPEILRVRFHAGSFHKDQLSRNPLSQATGAVEADTAIARFANGLFGVAVLGLMGGVFGLWSLRVGGSGWLPTIATLVTLIGLLLWMIGGLYLTTNASADQAFTPAGGLLSSEAPICVKRQFPCP